MQCEPVDLRFHSFYDFWMPMAQRKNSEPAKAINELTTIDVTQQTAFALPFDNSAFGPARFRPAIKIGVEILDALRDDLRFLVFGKFVIDPDLHWGSLSHKKAKSTRPVAELALRQRRESRSE